jgi:uncharacterized protein (TIGR03435 family)
VYGPVRHGFDFRELPPERNFKMTPRLTTGAAALAVLFAASNATHAQNESRPEFEVASVKPANITDLRASIQADGGRFLASATLKALVGFAYDVEDHNIVGGPSWITSGAWLVDARTGGTTPSPLPELQQMLQSLLADRFKLAVHRETREESVYELLSVKSGSKLKAAAAPGPPRLHNGRGQLGGQSVDTGMLARMLSGRLGRVVIDKTGFTGRYDFELTWVPAPGERDDGAIAGSISDPEGPALFTGLQEQLGLRLQSAKGPVPYLVIDRVEKSDPN